MITCLLGIPHTLDPFQDAETLATLSFLQGGQHVAPVSSVLITKWEYLSGCEEEESDPVVYPSSRGSQHPEDMEFLIRVCYCGRLCT